MESLPDERIEATAPAPVAAPTDPGTASGGDRLVFLDALRGIAAFTVAIQHGGEVIYGHGFRSWANHWFGLGKFGLIVFFLTSGFIIPYSLERGASVRRFWVGRFCRLYPAYWLSLALVLVLWALNQPSLPPRFASHIPRNAAVNVTMLQDFVGIPHAIQLYYTLSIELVFYFSCSVLFLLGLHKRSLLNAYACLALSVAGGIVAPFVLDHRMPFAGMVYISAMFLGTVLFRAWKGTIARSSAVVLLVANVTVMTVGAWINFEHFRGAKGPSFGAEPGGAANMFATMSAWLTGYVLFLICLGGLVRWFPPPITWLGRISYSVYLMHPVLLAVTRERTWPAWVALSLMLGGTLVLATLTYTYVERPMIHVGRRLQERWWPMHRKRPVPAPT
jgi:peptidoglycan/LPS O-acetylase OafA/YrhL